MQNITTNTENVTAIFDTEMEVKSRYIQLKNIFSEKNLYYLFAEPIGDGVKWKTEIDGDIIGFSELSEDEKEVAKIVLFKKVSALKKVLGESAKDRKFIKQILEVPSEENIHIIKKDGVFNVVLTFWGHRKNVFQSKKNIVSNMIGNGNCLTIKLQDGSDAIPNFPIKVIYHNEENILTTDSSGEIVIDDILKNSMVEIEFDTNSHDSYKKISISENIKMEEDSMKKEFILEKKAPPPPPPPTPIDNNDNFWKRNWKWLILLLLLLLGLGLFLWKFYVPTPTVVVPIQPPVIIEQNINFTLIDKDTRQPIKGVKIISSGSDNKLTNEQGKATLRLIQSEGGKRVQFLMNGYQSKEITIESGIDIDKTIYLKPLKVKIEGEAGDPRINISWETKDDIDIHVFDPCKKKSIYHGNKTAVCNGKIGKLDVDNLGKGTGIRQENITWDSGGSRGEYIVIINKYSNNSHSPTKVTIRTINNGQTTKKIVYLKGQKQKNFIPFEKKDSQYTFKFTHEN